MLLGNTVGKKGTTIKGSNDSRRRMGRLLFSWSLGVSHTRYSSCNTKWHKEDILTFHLNNLRISSSVSLAVETNRALEKRSSQSKIEFKINADTFVYISVRSDFLHSVFKAQFDPCSSDVVVWYCPVELSCNLVRQQHCRNTTDIVPQLYQSVRILLSHAESTS